MGGAASCAIVALAAATACEKTAGARGGGGRAQRASPGGAGLRPAPPGPFCQAGGQRPPAWQNAAAPPGPQRFCGAEA